MRCIREPVGVKCRKSPTATPVSAGAVRILNKQIRNAHKHGSVILSGASAESKNLRTAGTCARKSAERSFDSFRKSAIFFSRSG